MVERLPKFLLEGVVNLKVTGPRVPTKEAVKFFCDSFDFYLETIIIKSVYIEKNTPLYGLKSYIMIFEDCTFFHGIQFEKLRCNHLFIVDCYATIFSSRERFELTRSTFEALPYLTSVRLMEEDEIIETRTKEGHETVPSVGVINNIMRGRYQKVELFDRIRDIEIVNLRSRLREARSKEMHTPRLDYEVRQISNRCPLPALDVSSYIENEKQLRIQEDEDLSEYNLHSRETELKEQLTRDCNEDEKRLLQLSQLNLKRTLIDKGLKWILSGETESKMLLENLRKKQQEAEKLRREEVDRKKRIRREAFESYKSKRMKAD